MCGIIGAVSKRDIATILLEGLKRLEYRGYDSAGIAVIDANDHLECIRTSGKVNELIKLVNEVSLPGHTGIAHTRWATHGKPNRINAHPHVVNDEVAIVHNGIIENHAEIRKSLLEKGCIIKSETDSELIAHLVSNHIKNGKDFLSAVQALLTELKGAYAIGLIRKSEPKRLLALRCHSPLIIGLGDHETLICSDTLALLPLTNRFIYLEEGDIADIQSDNVTIYSSNGDKVNRTTHQINSSISVIDKGPYSHYMLKEIFEQPSAISRTLQSRISTTHVYAEAFGVHAPDIFKRVRRIHITSCGTSYHAGLVAKFWLEEIAKLPCEVEIASEYRYRNHIVEPDTLFITLSQSGETADTLAALRLAKKSAYISTLSICNVPGSSLVRESELALLLDAGAEIGVASTKAFTCQLAALFMLAIALGHHNHLSAKEEAELVNILRSIPSHVEAVLKLSPDIKELTSIFYDRQNAIYIARGMEFPIALEGALKLKEISYIHAEAYPAGELKHGPLALISKIMPVVTLAPDNELIDKIKSNIEEIQARGGEMVIFTDGNTMLTQHDGIKVIILPHVHKFISPIVYVIPLQLLAYHVAAAKGTDIDQPRNLAKSVTVE